MTDLIDETIEQLLKDNDEEGLISVFREIMEGIGANPSQEEIVTAISNNAYEAIRDTDSSESVTLSDEEKEYMFMATRTVEEYLDSRGWHYDLRHIGSDMIAYNLDFRVADISLRTRIIVEADPNVCRIEAVLPFTADITYEYPLCKVLADKNEKKRYGSFKYDDEDGEISYEYTIRAENGIDKEDLRFYIHIVVGTAAEECKDIQRYSLGKFKSEEKSEIANKINSLLKDIKDNG